MTKKEEIIARFREKFSDGLHVDLNTSSGSECSRDYVGEDLESFLSSVVDEVREDERNRILDKFKKVDKDRWNDAVHCSCLAHAIYMVDRKYKGGADPIK